MGEATITDWHGCYDGNWNGLIIPEAFAHPAKYAYGLISRIIRHGLEQGYWDAGDTIGDCFGGIASGGIIAGYHGLNWIGVELEPRFVELGNKNLAMHGSRWMAAGDVVSVKLVQGDSRRFAEIVGEVVGVVSSPPFLGARAGTTASSETSGGGPCADRVHTIADGDRLGSHPGQIAAMRVGSIDAVVSSPPYAESIRGDHTERETAAESTAKRTTPGGSLGQSMRHGGYGASEGNIGNLREGAIDGVVTSPPFEDGSAAKAKSYSGFDHVGSVRHKFDESTGCYGTTVGQIGESAGETYWQAMRAVYAQMHAALKPGGVAAIVLKNYVAKGQIVPLCDDSCRLLESLGFHVFERTRAWLVKEERHPSLFGGEEVTTTERKSFFRRLAEKKGSPRIDFEEVIWCRKSDARRGVGHRDDSC